MAGLYVHVPFCASRCIYCGFYSTIPTRQKDNGLTIEEQYVNALCNEMQLRANELDEPIRSIYLGGGTPSQLAYKSLQQIFSTIKKVFHITWNKNNSPLEITMECNPDDVTDTFVRDLQKLPINRISMGVQTFSDERLRFLHRRHTADEVELAIKRLRKIGIHNISIDLMFGFPNETMNEWKSDIDRAIQLDVEHLSAYSLMYEEGTPLYQLLKNGKVKEIDDELYRQMYDLLINSLTQAGYEHYEISNFAKLKPQRSNIKGQPSKVKDQSPFRSLHNSSYWHNVPYIGLGAAAHSYNNSKRSWNVADIKAYISVLKDNKRPYEEEFIDEDTHYNDMIMTALRTREGLQLSTLSEPYQDYLMRLARPLIQQNLLKEDDGWLHLTHNGIYVSDAIMSDLMKV